MQPSLYVALSGQIALQRRLETIAHNVANVSTAGFRAEEVKFSSLLSQVSPDPTHFATSKGTYISRRAGEVTPTQDPFDVAIKGDAWMSISIDGQQVYTRDGRLRMSPTGDLQTVEGYPVLDVGGAPITIDPNGGPPKIADDGAINQGDRQLGVIGLFTIPPEATMVHVGNSSVIPSVPAEPALDFTRYGVAQGFIERSNVNPVLEMTHLIAVQRAFESLTNSMDATEAAFVEGIRTLGSTS